MANYETVDDLRTEALRRAGEPQSSTSDFWTDSLLYLNKIQQVLLLGGGAAVGRDLATSAGIYSQLVSQPITDWWWARKEGVFNTVAALNTGTVTATQGSTTITFSSAPAISVTGWRIEINSKPTIPKISAHIAGVTTATLDAAWPEETQTTQTYKCWQEKYTLATDFLRFAGAPEVHSNVLGTITVCSREQMLEYCPRQLAVEGEPNLAAMIEPRVIVFDAYDTTQGYRFEYDYICKPTDLVAGATPLLPHHHRQVLSVGAAMVILFDKHDTRAEGVASEYRELVARMAQEHRKALTSGSSVFGQFKCRPGPYKRQRSLQPKGELYLT